MSAKMFNWDEEWNISFAGCGFRSIYYLGALSCIFQKVPQLLHGASKISGASSGCLVAAALTIGIPIEQFCVDVLNMAKEASKHTLGVFHPSFSLLRAVQDSLLERLPADAHIRASGKLCVSLTRLADGENVLVSEFDSREELIQVLMCSCFFPVYCGFSPPSYRGVRYMDGALSNNMPLFEQRNTITLSPFSGESDICPREGTFNFFEAHYGNVSIQVNTGNVHRVCTSFLPPKLEKLAEICHNGYMDAHRFLRERDLLGAQPLLPSLVMETDTVNLCCEPVKPRTPLTEDNHNQEDHWWLDVRVIENLPVSLKTVLCEACRDTDDGSRFLSVKVIMYLLSLLMLPIELTILLTKSLILLGCIATCRLLKLTTNLKKKTWRKGCEDPISAFPGHLCSSRSSNSDLKTPTRGDKKRKPLKSTITLNSNKTPHWDNNCNMDLFSFTSACGAPLNSPNTKTRAYGKTALNHRSKSTLHQL